MGKKHKPPKRKQRLVNYFNEQAGVCVYCHDDMTLDLRQSNTATIDHVIPRNKGGKSVENNEVACCSECNSRKSDKHVVAFLKETAARSAKPVIIQFPLFDNEPEIA